MGSVSHLGQGLHVSISTIAAEFAITRETAAKRIAEARIAPSGKRGGYPVYRLKDVVPALIGSLDGSGREDPERLDPYRRQAHYKAALDRLKLEQETRELIPRIECEQEQARILRIVALALDTLPDVVERDCGGTAAQVQRIERAVDECREALYGELSEDDGELRERA